MEPVYEIDFSALDPEPGEAAGRSLLRGLPFLSSVLMEIYRAIGENFRRLRTENCKGGYADRIGKI